MFTVRYLSHRSQSGIIVAVISYLLSLELKIETQKFIIVTKATTVAKRLFFTILAFFLVIFVHKNETDIDKQQSVALILSIIFYSISCVFLAVLMVATLLKQNKNSDNSDAISTHSADTTTTYETVDTVRGNPNNTGNRAQKNNRFSFSGSFHGGFY